VELCVFDEQGNEQRRSPGAQRRHLARLAGRCRAGPALRLPGAWSLGPGAGAPL
jgi:hypothetical protein